MKRNKWRVASLTACLTLALVACNTSEREEQKAKVSQAAEVQTEAPSKEEVHKSGELSVGTRYIISSEVGIHVVNEKFEKIEQFQIGSGAFTVADSGRYLFVRDATNKDSYTLLDSGLYIENHDDHIHLYEETPILAEEVTAAQPAHMISHAGRTAIFHDGSGQVDVYENASLTTEGLTPDTVYQGVAHHGAAVPLSTGELAVTYVTNEGDALPSGVKIVDAAGTETAVVTNSCDSLHGTAYGGHAMTEKLAFGCIGKVVVYDVATKKAVDTILPDAGARVGTVKLGQDSDYFLTNYSIEGQPQNKVGIANAQNGEFTVLTLPAAYKSATLVAPKNIAYVLAEDGNVYQIDLKAATLIATISALNPFSLEEESPSLFLANDKVHVVMPSAQKIYEIHGNHVHETVKLDFVPTAIAVVEAK